MRGERARSRARDLAAAAGRFAREMMERSCESSSTRGHGHNNTGCTDACLPAEDGARERVRKGGRKGGNLCIFSGMVMSFLMVPAKSLDHLIILCLNGTTPQRQLAQGFFQPLLGKPEVFPQQMGCIIPPVSLNVITSCVPGWMGLKTLHRQPPRWAG